MPGKRRLFIAHASELAYLLAKAAGPGGVVTAFVHGYAERNNRRALLHSPENLREIESAIGREALLVMAAEAGRLVPHAFASSPRGVPGPEQAAVSRAFLEELRASLGRAIADSPQRVFAGDDTFGRDFEMYDRWAARARDKSAPKSAGAAESPFPDRCALLLDPSMMEQARRAAVGFELELTRLAARTFERLGRPHDRRDAARAHPARKAHRRRTPRPAPRKRARKAAGRRRTASRARGKRPRR